MEVGGQLPFKVEYSKSNRASCKGCKEKIPKEVVRMARMMKSRHHDGVDPNWFHPKCFFQKAKQWGLNSGEIEKIGGFHDLRVDDQESIQKSVDSITGVGGGKVGKAGASKATLTDFEIGYAPSSRAKCRRGDCKDEKIEKNELRIAVKQVDEEKPHLGPIPRWHHAGCFKKVRKELDWRDEYTADMIPGFSALDKADQAQIRVLLKPKKVSKTKNEPKVKVEMETKAETKPTAENKQEKALKDQNKNLWSIKDQLKSQLNTSDLKELLVRNKIDVPTGEAAVLDTCADLIVFGRLPRCKECSTGQLYVDKNGYYACKGNISGFTRCTFVSLESKRVAPKIPREFMEASSYLGKYKFDSKSIRIFPKQSAIPPLTEMKILILGKVIKKAALESEITLLGGKNAAALDQTVHLIISEKASFEALVAKEKKSERLLKAETLNVTVVDRAIVDDLKGAAPKLGERRIDLATFIANHKLSSFGDYKPPGKRKRVDVAEEAKQREAKKIKLTVTDGACVDPEAFEEVPEGSIIITDSGSGRLYTSMMTLVDLKKDKNSYYKLQAIQNKQGTRFFIFRSWGRIGSDTVGGTKVETFHVRHNCISAFQDLFLEKTANDFLSSNYVKMPDRFFPMEIDYSVPEDSTVDLSADHQVKSKLSKEVQSLIKLIFNVKAMKKALVQFDLDLEKMPLGKLSKTQLKKAWTVLNEILKYIKVRFYIESLCTIQSSANLIRKSRFKKNGSGSATKSSKNQVRSSILL